MSVEAMTWAYKQKLKSSVKFILVTLCDYAGSDFRFWPSIPDLVEKTCQDRKTIIAAIDTLEQMGFIVDSGERKGRTKQIKVYFVDLNNTKSGTVEECQKRNSTANGTVPDFPSNSTVFPAKEYQISAERVPKTLHGTINEPLNEPSGNHKYNARRDLKNRGVNDQIIDDWLILRKTKRAAVTATAVDGIEREAGKAGMSLGDALKLCCEQGWQGFKADWVAAKAEAGRGSQKKTIYEQNREAGKRAKEMLFGASHD